MNHVRRQKQLVIVSLNSGTMGRNDRVLSYIIGA